MRLERPAALPVADDHARFIALRRFDDLDGLRAIAVLGVIWHHTAGSAFPNSALSWAGSQGVTLFFAISGFLITSLLLRERDRHGRIDLPAFYMRRTLRIFPIYYVALALYVVLVWVFERDSTYGRDFFGNLGSFATYTSNWFVELRERTIFYFAWSLAAEEQFYLVWPPLLVLLGTNRRALVFLLAAVAAIIALHIALARADDGASIIKWSQRVPLALVLASTLAVALHGRATNALISPWFAHPLSSVAAALVLAWAFIVPGWPDLVVHIACAWLVVSIGAARSHPFAAVLRLRALAYLGTISYGMYLLHMLCAAVVKMALKTVGIASVGVFAFVGTTIVTIIVAGLSFKYFESPILALKRRYER